MDDADRIAAERVIVERWNNGWRVSMRQPASDLSPGWGKDGWIQLWFGSDPDQAKWFADRYRACLAAAIRDGRAELLAACEAASEQLDNCDCSNGVTSPMGDIDEGEVWAGRVKDKLVTAIRNATENKEPNHA